MTALPSVEPLPPGARPTEPGWYVYRTRRGDVSLMEAEPYGKDNELVGYNAGDFRALRLDDFTFIARIYPDRIGQE